MRVVPDLFLLQLPFRVEVVADLIGAEEAEWVDRDIDGSDDLQHREDQHRQDGDVPLGCAYACRGGHSGRFVDVQPAMNLAAMVATAHRRRHGQRPRVPARGPPDDGGLGRRSGHAVRAW